mmetsp:Transcript_8486/g.12485  ORF Transcript_8486/g.12485 Transcript_8486/m.12485 type:complete len:81 (+) Transcript_8486:76-318(+)
MVKVEYELKTAPPDPRFPTANQTRHCYARYIEFHRCVKAREDDEAPECQKFKNWYTSLCPVDWVEKWDEQREEGTFAGPI